MKKHSRPSSRSDLSWCLCLVLLASLARPGMAQPEPTVDEIIARHLEARGGADVLSAIETLVYSGGTYSEGEYTGSGDAMMAFARPYHRVVGNPESPGGYMEGYDGAAWEWYADPGIVVRTVGAAAGATRRGTQFDGPFLDYEAKGSTIDLEPSERIGDRLAYRLVVTMRDGFVREYFVDQESYLVIAERRTAPIHAFGDPVTSEERISDYRPVVVPAVPSASGAETGAVRSVLFPHAFIETDIDSGEKLNSMRWGRVEANRELPASWWSPPEFERSPLQRFLELLYRTRTDQKAVLWSYRDFRRAHPEIDTREGIETIGYQMLKMGDHEAAIALLEANARDYPDASSSAFSLGRAYETAGQRWLARPEYERALELDPENKRAARALAAMDKLKIGLASGTEEERAAKAQLVRLVKTYDLERWFFTHEVVIDATEPVPHSHPVLTLNTEALAYAESGDQERSDLAQLASFLHEQFHWARGVTADSWRNANADFRELFPEAPDGFRGGGARDHRSTIGHLITCDLEFQAMTLLVGEEKARRTLEGWEHYPWVYERVLTDPEVRRVNERHGWVVRAD